MKAMKHEKLLHAMDEGADPPVIESREQRLARVLSLVGGKVRPAATFTVANAIKAAAIAHGKARN